MPELAAIFTLGAIANLGLTTLFVYLWKKRQSTGPFATLAENLLKAGLYWSDGREALISVGDGSKERDDRASVRNIILTGSLLTLLSWPGVLFHLVIMVSYRFLARSRLEKRLLASELARSRALSASRVHTLVKELNKT